MKTDISDADRIAGNADVLGIVETEIAALEQAFVALDSLNIEKDRLTGAIESLTAEEGRTLEDDGSESQIVKKLGELRTRREVQASRLGSIQEKIKEQTADLAIQGANVRRAFAAVMAQLAMSRQAQATAILTDLFGGPVRLRIGRIELRELRDHTAPIKQLKEVNNRVSHTISDQQQETLALQRTRTWLAEIRSLVDAEPGLVLKGVPAKEPIEHPVMEMATA
jgi:hypothetical protein